MPAAVEPSNSGRHGAGCARISISPEFEQQLYLRQPGYGTSYVTGQYLIDEPIKDRARQLGDKFTMRQFFDEFLGAGMIPTTC